jgi:CBS domain-containing protein
MNQKIKDVMTREVECARPDMSLREVAERMKRLDIGSLPVCEGKKVVGIVTDRDLAIRGLAEGRNPEQTRAQEVMSRDVVACVEDDDLEKAEKLMHDRQVRRLPVLNPGGELVGYLAMAKIAKTEDAQQAGRVLKGVSQKETPRPMTGGGYEAKKRAPKKKDTA